MSRAAAKKAAMCWKRAASGAWPADAIYARDDGRRGELQRVRLGYLGEWGEFIEVVELRFNADGEAVYVDDRRARKTKWPGARSAATSLDSEAPSTPENPHG